MVTVSGEWSGSWNGGPSRAVVDGGVVGDDNK